MKKVLITRKPGVVSQLAYEPPTNFGIHNDQTVDPIPSKPQSYGERRARRKERKKWNIKRVIPFVKKFRSLNVVIKDAEQEVKANRTAMNVSKLEEKILMLNNFLKELPFPKSKLEAYARFA